MKKPWKHFGLACLLIAALTAAGCQGKQVAINPSPSVTNSPEPIVAIDVSVVSEPPTSTPSIQPSATPSDGEHVAHVSSNTNPKVNEQSPSSVAPKQTTKPKIAEKDTYQQEKPTLMGLKLGSAKSDVLKKFGAAVQEFVMDEDEAAISVYEYTDFSIGFNVKNQLEFVDVHTAEIDPGLGGLRLGQNPDDAIRILGKPDSNTTFVLSYKAQGTILKLDIDPKANTIQSIKLFAG
ncbi:hypothetical protein D3C73_870990 [compost metagenome]